MGQGAAAGGMSLAATGFKMLGEYESSRGTAAADVYTAQELEQQAQYGELKAQQTNAQMTKNLAITLGHIDAVRAAAHTDPTSPTGAAVRGEVEETGEMRKEITVENILQQTRMDEAQAAYMRSAASNALLSGDINMAATAFGGASTAFAPTPGGQPGPFGAGGMFGSGTQFMGGGNWLLP
jgi:hypothetical protein